MKTIFDIVVESIKEELNAITSVKHAQIILNALKALMLSELMKLVILNLVYKTRYLVILEK